MMTCKRRSPLSMSARASRPLAALVRSSWITFPKLRRTAFHSDTCREGGSSACSRRGRAEGGGARGGGKGGNEGGRGGRGRAGRPHCLPLLTPADVGVGGFGVWDLGFGVYGLWFGVWGLGIGVQGLGFRVEGWGLRDFGAGFRV